MSIIADKSRAEYFRQRRESQKTFSVIIEREKVERLERKLKEKGVSKTDWLNQKIDDELSQ